MPTRRRYKGRGTAAEPFEMAEGGAVPGDPSENIVIVTHAADGGVIADHEPNHDYALSQAVAASHRAEELHRQQPQHHHPVPPLHHAIAHHVRSLPGLSNHKRGFLIQHPELLVHAQIASKHHAEALRAGIPDDTPEMDAHLLRSVSHEIAQRHGGHPSAPARPASSPVQSVRSMPMTAPVSRDVPMSSGSRHSTSTVTLNPEEREVARLAYARMPADEAERLYAQQKLKLQRKRASGEYTE